MIEALEKKKRGVPGELRALPKESSIWPYLAAAKSSATTSQLTTFQKAEM